MNARCVCHCESPSLPAMLRLPTPLLLICLSYLPWSERLSQCSRLCALLPLLASKATDADHLVVSPSLVSVLDRHRSTSSFAWLRSVRSVSLDFGRHAYLASRIPQPLLSLCCQRRCFEAVQRLQCSACDFHALVNSVPLLHLRSLWLTCGASATWGAPSCHDGLVEQLERLPQLHRLKLSDCQLTAANRRGLLALQQLTDVDLSEARCLNEIQAARAVH